MSGVTQATFMNQRSFKPPPPGAIGSAYEGGFYAGSISTTANGVATHYLVIGPLSTAQSSLAWKTSNTATTGTSSVIDGPSNSSAMNNATHPAAQFCEALSIGGFTDWYMPAKNEFEVCYFNLKPTTTSNNTSFGINANSVPRRNSNYTAGTPAQTSAAAFQSGGAEAFASAYYWNSTEYSSSEANSQSTLDGTQSFFGDAKTTVQRVRAVRRVPI